MRERRVGDGNICYGRELVLPRTSNTEWFLCHRHLSRWKACYSHGEGSLRLRLRLYNCYILSYLLHNCATLGRTQNVSGRLPPPSSPLVTPYAVSKYNPNTEFYNLCRAQPISKEIAARWWSFLGHVLRVPSGAQPQVALDFPASGAWRGRRGRPRTTLLTTLSLDYQDKLGLVLLSWPGLTQLREVADDRCRWNYYCVSALLTCLAIIMRLSLTCLPTFSCACMYSRRKCLLVKTII